MRRGPAIEQRCRRLRWPNGRTRADEPSARAESEDAPLRTEFTFRLPRGYVDGDGRVHRDGVMRLATARDELIPLRDDRVRENPAFLTVVLLGRVVTRIGEITDIHSGVIESLFASDLAFLQDLYRRVNTEGHTRAAVAVSVVPAPVRRRRLRRAPGGIVTYATDRLYEEISYLAYHFHWSIDDLLDLEHPERRRYATEIGRINTKISTGR